MQRNVVLPIIGGVVAALVFVGAIVLIAHRHNTPDVTISTPPPSESALASLEPSLSPSPSASASASPSASPAASAAASAKPSGTPKPTAKPTPTPHPVRAVSSVNCSAPSDAQFCSKKDQATYGNNGDSVTTPPTNPSPSPYPNAATISMQSTAQSGNIHVVVTVENKTSKTFHFPKREIDLVITKDGQAYYTLATNGAAFDMAPGTKMTGTFDRPVTMSGTYAWQAKTWYYAK